jgi:hypothetical protein
MKETLKTSARVDRRQQPHGLHISFGVLRLAAFAFGLGVTLPTLAQTISGSSLTITASLLCRVTWPCAPGIRGSTCAATVPQATALTMTRQR